MEERASWVPDFFEMQMGIWAQRDSLGRHMVEMRRRKVVVYSTE